MTTDDHQYPVFESGQTLTAAELNTLARSCMSATGWSAGWSASASTPGSAAPSPAHADRSTRARHRPGRRAAGAHRPRTSRCRRRRSRRRTTSSPRRRRLQRRARGPTDVTTLRRPAARPTAPVTPSTAHRGVDVRVAGRVTGTWFDFAHEALLVRPIRVAGLLADQLLHDLRDAIVDRLTNGSDPLVAPALITKLRHGHGPAVPRSRATSAAGSTWCCSRPSTCCASGAADAASTARPPRASSWAGCTTGRAGSSTAATGTSGSRHAGSPRRSSAGPAPTRAGSTATSRGADRRLRATRPARRAGPPPLECPTGTIRVTATSAGTSTTRPRTSPTSGTRSGCAEPPTRSGRSGTRRSRTRAGWSTRG